MKVTDSGAPPDVGVTDEVTRSGSYTVTWNDACDVVPLLSVSVSVAV